MAADKFLRDLGVVNNDFLKKNMFMEIKLLIIDYYKIYEINLLENGENFLDIEVLGIKDNKFLRYIIG